MLQAHLQPNPLMGQLCFEQLCFLGALALDRHATRPCSCTLAAGMLHEPPSPRLPAINMLLLLLLQMTTTGSCRPWKVTRATCWRCWQAARRQHVQLGQRQLLLQRPAVEAQAAAWQQLQVLPAVGTGVSRSSRNSRACLPQPLGRVGGHLLLLVAAVG
jgi:hypothetical protein